MEYLFYFQEVQLNGDSITTTKGFKEIRSVHILFEETYYNDNDESYRVVCIDRLLEGGNGMLTRISYFTKSTLGLYLHFLSVTCQRQIVRCMV